MVSQRLGRRSFLAGSIAGAASLTMARPAFSAANEEVRLAIIGAGWRGGQLAAAFHAAQHARLVAVVDPDQQRANELAEKYNIPALNDLKQVLDDPNVDAVAIATCNHWHCLATIWALDAGKHVYVEKPLGHNQWEGKQVVAAAQASDRIVQVGLQQRSDPMQAEIRKFLHEEKALGDIRYVQANRLGRREPIGKRQTPLKPAEYVDYNLWLGPALDEPILRSELHYDWHWDWNTGNGEMGNWGVHILDDIRNVVYQDSISTPKRIVAAGGRVAWEDAGNTPNVHYALFETDSFPTLIALSNLAGQPGERSSWKCPTEGVNGPSSGYVVACEGGYYLGQRGKGRAIDRDGKTIREFKGGDIVPLHTQNFVDAVRANDPAMLSANILVGHQSTGWCNLANIGIRAGGPYSQDQIELASKLDAWPSLVEQMEQQLRPFDVTTDRLVASPVLNHDPETERFVGENAELANRFLKRTYRDGFRFPELVS